MNIHQKLESFHLLHFGKENGILLGLKADDVIIELEENNNIIQNVIVGIYNGHLNKTGKYKALIGLELLDYKEENIYGEHIRNIKV